MRLKMENICMLFILWNKTSEFRTYHKSTYYVTNASAILPINSCLFDNEMLRNCHLFINEKLHL